MHASRLRGGRAVFAPVRSAREECSVEGCLNLHSAKGLCKTHYSRKRDGVPLDRPARMPIATTKCTYPDCGRWAVGLGACAGHRAQIRKYGRMVAPVAVGRTKYKITTCAIVGCDRPHYANAMCQRHSSKASKYHLTAIQLQALLLVDRCAVCSDPLHDGNRAIDHDHSCCPGAKSCGECIRGVLCMKCNAGIGYFDNRPGVLMAAIEYLLKP